MTTWNKIYRDKLKMHYLNAHKGKIKDYKLTP